MRAPGTGLLGSLEELIERGDFVVPPYPAAALKLRRIVDRANFGLSEVADAASADPALAASLLRVANSAMYRGTGAAITTLGRAVHRLGARTVASVALASQVSGVACDGGPLIDVKYKVWRRSLTCALACQQLAPSRALDPEEAFLAGLLHGFGRSVALGCLERVLPKNAEARPLIEWLSAIEPHRLGLARRVAESWQLPSEIVQAVAAGSPKSPRTPMGSLIELCDELAALVDQGASAEQIASAPGLSSSEGRLVLGFVAKLPHALEALVENNESVRRITGAPSAVSKPPTSLRGDLRPLGLALADLKNRKEPRKLDAIAVNPEGLVFLSAHPMQESCVARLALGSDPHVIEGWFSVTLCTREKERFRVEVQAFAPSRELKEFLAQQWAAAQKR